MDFRQFQKMGSQLVSINAMLDKHSNTANLWRPFTGFEPAFVPQIEDGRGERQKQTDSLTTSTHIEQDFLWTYDFVWTCKMTQ